MNANVYLIEDYENETTLRPKKTNPNKPNFKRHISLFCSLESIVCCLQSVLCSRMKPKLLNFHRKNSLKYPFLCSERECFYEELYGKKRPGRAEMAPR